MRNQKTQVRSTKRKAKSRAKEYTGQKCELCGKPWRKGLRFAEHHVCYKPEVKSLVCWGCHAWLHGNAVVYRHEFKEKYGRDLAPYYFALAVVMLYGAKVNVPDAQRRAVIDAATRMADRLWNDTKDTVH